METSLVRAAKIWSSQCGIKVWFALLLLAQESASEEQELILRPLFVLPVAILHLWTSPGEIYQHTHFSLCPCCGCFHVRADRVLALLHEGILPQYKHWRGGCFQCVRFIYVRFPSKVLLILLSASAQHEFISEMGFSESWAFGPAWFFYTFQLLIFTWI